MGIDPLTAGLIIATTAFSVDQQKSAQRETREAQAEQQELELAIQGEQAARERRSQISKGLVERSKIENAAAAGGQSLSSAAVVGGQDVASQVGTNIQSINTAVGSSNKLGQAQQKVANSGQVSTAGQIAGTVSSSMIQAGTAQATKSLFTA